MKEFKYCHEEITMGVEIPVTVCETQKEMVSIIVDYRDSFKFAMESLDEVMKSHENGGFDYEDVFGRMKRNERAYHRAIDTALCGTDEETVYIIYKDGSTYFQNGGMGCEGKFKRTGIARAMISTAYEAFVFGDFAINDMGDVTIEESDIEEYGVYAGQYDVKEQEVQEAEQETAETVEGISKMEIPTETGNSGFEYYSVKVAYEVIKDEMRSVLFLGYSLALKVAEDFTDTWGGDKAIITAVSLIIRNDRQPESERDKRILETETAEIERRCVPYHNLGLSGYVSIEDRQDIA